MTDLSRFKTQERKDFEFESLLFLASAMQVTESQRRRLAAEQSTRSNILIAEAHSGLAA